MRIAYPDGGHLDVDFVVEVEVCGRCLRPDGSPARGVLEAEALGATADRFACVLDDEGRASLTLATDGTTRDAFVAAGRCAVPVRRGLASGRATGALDRAG
jgi:hypothetical protein